MNARISIQSCIFLLLILLTATAAADIPVAGIYQENFDTDTYHDATATTAYWWTMGSQALVTMRPKELVTNGSFGAGVTHDVAVSGDYVFCTTDGAGLVVFEAAATGSVYPIGNCDTGGEQMALVVAGNYAFVADGSAGLQIIDVSNPYSPVPIRNVPMPGTAVDVIVTGDRAYVACYNEGLQVVNINYPPAAYVITSYQGVSGVSGLDVSGDYAYVSDRDTGFMRVVDISNPSSPSPAGSYYTGGVPSTIDVEGDFAYVGMADNGMLVIDVSDPTTPVEAGSFVAVTVDRLDVAGQWAYYSSGIGTLSMMDMRDPTNLVHWGSIPINGFAEGIVVSGDFVYVAAGSAGLQSYRIADLLPPVDVGGLSGSGYAKDVVVQGRKAYVVNENSGFQIFDIAEPETPVALGALTGVAECVGLDVDGDLVALAHQSGGVSLVDVSDSMNPVLIRTQSTIGAVNLALNAVQIDGNRLHIAGGGSIDYSNLDITDPTGVWNGGGTGFATACQSVHYDGDSGVVAVGTGGVKVLDLSDGGSSPNYYTVTTPDARAAIISGNLLYVADAVNGIMIYDIASGFATFASSQATSGIPTDLKLAGKYLFVAEGAAGFEVFDVSDGGISLAHSYSSAYPVEALDVVGDYCYIAGGNGGLQVVGVLQRSFDMVNTAVQSLVFANEPHDVVQMRLTATEAPAISWYVSSVAGLEWTGIPSDGSWTTLQYWQGTELKWRSNHVVVAPRQNPSCQDLQIEWLYDVPGLVAVDDVPNDQGRQVSLTWHRSGFDAAGSLSPIVDYAIYRRIDGAAAAKANHATDKAYPPGDWHYVMSVPANAEDQYAVVVPTLADSTVTEGMQRSTFFVRARTATPSVYYDADPDSGYSVDNLIPETPTGLVFAGTTLSWDEPLAADFKHFTVYASQTATLDADAAVVGHTVGTSLDVTGFTPNYFLLTATDFSGNESTAAMQGQVSATAGSTPHRFALHGNYPNPFNPVTSIVFELENEAPVQLAVFDVAGRLVRSLIDGQVMGSGRHEKVWDGRDESGRQVAGGVYFYRIRSTEFSATRPMSLVK